MVHSVIRNAARAITVFWPRRIRFRNICGDESMITVEEQQ